ncbi:hypothetical protein Tco_0936757 [Tanacetum coccineum]|uniref:Uncharacterized protein n=1 Tax=Tanacetum coccineum TaxID=301880 RepID=A0ABQ5DDD7_9ASTR
MCIVRAAFIKRSVLSFGQSPFCCFSGDRVYEEFSIGVCVYSGCDAFLLFHAGKLDTNGLCIFLHGLDLLQEAYVSKQTGELTSYHSVDGNTVGSTVTFEVDHLSVSWECDMYAVGMQL